MKRVLIFSLTYHPFVGGAEIAIKEITDRLSPEDFHFTMITLRLDSSLPRVEKVGNITVHRIGFSVPGAKVSDRSIPWQCKLSKALFPVTAFWKAVVLHRGHRIDMAWAMMANQAGFAALFFKWMYPRVPYFLELQDGRPLADMRKRRPSMRLLWPLYAQVYRSANIVKCISYFIAEQVRLINYAGTVEVIPNGVDVERFAREIVPEKLSAFRAKFDTKESDTLLFTASRLVLSRGVEDCVQALQYLPESVRLLIAGDGDDRTKLERLAASLGVAERVIFAGHVPHGALPMYFKAADIFVRPSIIEGFGNVFVEAFAAGVPVVGTPVGGIPDFLKDGVTGLFCSVRDPASIARAVERYRSDLVLRAHIVEHARNVARETYDWDRIARDMKTRIFLAV